MADYEFVPGRDDMSAYEKNLSDMNWCKATIGALHQRVKELEELSKAWAEKAIRLKFELDEIKAGQGEWEKAVLGQHSITYDTSAPSIPEGWHVAVNADTPKYGERVIVLTTDADGDPVHELAHFNGKLGYLGTGGKRIKPVSHWMRLLAAPKPGEPK